MSSQIEILPTCVDCGRTMEFFAHEDEGTVTIDGKEFYRDLYDCADCGTRKRILRSVD